MTEQSQDLAFHERAIGVVVALLGIAFVLFNMQGKDPFAGQLDSIDPRDMSVAGANNLGDKTPVVVVHEEITVVTDADMEEVVEALEARLAIAEQEAMAAKAAHAEALSNVDSSEAARALAEAARAEAVAQAQEHAEAAISAAQERDNAREAQSAALARAQAQAAAAVAAQQALEQAEADDDVSASETVEVSEAQTDAYGVALGETVRIDLPKDGYVEVPNGGFEFQLVEQLKNQSSSNQPLVFDRLFFDSGSWDPGPRSEAQIVATAKILDAYDVDSLALKGHTDAQGEESLNYRLSLDRASAVRAKLQENGVKADISVIGKGELEPRESNESEEGRALNRRIELVISD